MNNRERDLKKYIEIFFLIILSVGPFSPAVKIVIYCGVLLMSFKHVATLRKIKWLNFALICSMIIPMILDIRNVDSTTPYSLASFAFLAPFIFSLVYIQEFKKPEFLAKLEQIIFVLTIISIIGFLIVLFMPSIIERFPTVIYYGRRVNTIGIYGAIRDYTKVNFLLRNCGLAFEPGAFQFIPNLGLAILVSNNERNKDWRYWIKVFTYAIAVMSTYSTTGMVILSLLLLISSFSNRRQFILMLLVVAILSSALLTSFQYQKEKLQSGNFEARFERTVYVFHNFSDNILGLGSTGYDKIYNENQMIGSWDTFTNMYLRFGLFFTFFLFFMCLRLCRISIYICITVMLTLLTESLIGPVVVMLFYYSGQTTSEKKLGFSKRYKR